jgi:hypothetical protein
MSSTPYLEPVAAALGDREQSPRAGRPLPLPLPVPTVSVTVLSELDYAGALFERMEKAVEAELQALEGAGVRLVGFASLRASMGLSQLAAQVRLAAMLARAGRPA